MAHTKETRRRSLEKTLSRRKAWLSENGPCAVCGSSEFLEIDHINPETKVSHNVWSWSESRRTEELKKCQVLCKKCHKEKTRADNSVRQTGKKREYLRKVSEAQVDEAIILHRQGYRVRELASRYSVAHNTLAVAMKRRREGFLTRASHRPSSDRPRGETETGPSRCEGRSQRSLSPNHLGCSYPAPARWRRKRAKL